jgi:hypothetical protein
MRILILEDNDERIKWFKEVYKNHELFICKTLKEAELSMEMEIDVFFLDHDLDAMNLLAIEQENTGYDLVKWIVENKFHPKAIYYIHSMNPTGANVMLNLLLNNKYEAQWIPFHLLKLEER